MLFLIESSVDYPKESDGTINQSGKLNFFLFLNCQTEIVYFVYTFVDYIYYLFILQADNWHD